MEFAEQCSFELEKLGRGHVWFNDVYFPLEEIKKLPAIIQRLNYIDNLVLFTFHINDEGMMEAYWYNLSIQVVDTVQDKNSVLLSDTGRNTLEELGDYSIELWNNTYYQVRKGDIKGFIESINQYVSFMEKNEGSLREEYDLPNKEKQGIYYQVLFI
ncbi:hypothetical protein [Planococcus dechangensis]|uniref:Uncharacterized protein n=1 Tax=Planococcus dechangensis TaxID=1176255 RepID=A0ABV9MEV1_9BACL